MHSAPQAGQRALYFSVSGIMAFTTFIKDTGILCPLLLGLLLPSVLVSGQSSTTLVPSSTTQNPTITTAPTTTMTSNTPTTTAPTTTMTTNPPTTTSSTATTTLGSTAMASSTTAASQGSTTMTSSTMTSGTTTQPASSTTSRSTTTSAGAGSTTMAQSSTSMTSTSGMSVTNGTMMANTSSMYMLYCPSFMCNYSDCYTMYTNQNTTSCSIGDSCQLLRQDNMCYTVGCSPSCAVTCVNASQVNCSVNCCNSTGCLNDSFASMMMTTTTMAMTTTTTPVPTTTTTSPPTTANKGNKCHNGTCTGTDCYTAFKTAPLQMCSASHPHCQLKKETVDSTLKWSAGCTNCSVHTACKASTQPPCNLECCNATMSSCLWLNGTLNVPSFATRGPYLHTGLIAASLCLLAITLMM
ncbi:cell wall protein DAN4 isoform X1 [Mugil cephalus]|uniref:cell wall protein DAN4 isoform X1 n=1 Tax=Mugil cephalus TaxID=48193 RepID=UPI001FB7D156|nr:cell wall protein DAN4 isoform X1 [Mugil cephalus]